MSDKKWTVHSISEPAASADGKTEAYSVVATFHVRPGLDVLNAAGIRLDIPVGGGAAAVRAALDAHWALEVEANPVLEQPADALTPQVPADLVSLLGG